MLTLTLRNLERDGLITRELFPEVPPRVEYELTGLGKSLLEPTQALLDWVGNNWPNIKKARGKFDDRALERS
jgi:DNA-binding HxlR family transcriptional regulator